MIPLEIETNEFKYSLQFLILIFKSAFAYCYTSVFEEAMCIITAKWFRIFQCPQADDGYYFQIPKYMHITGIGLVDCSYRRRHPLPVSWYL